MKHNHAEEWSVKVRKGIDRRLSRQILGKEPKTMPNLVKITISNENESYAKHKETV